MHMSSPVIAEQLEETPKPPETARASSKEVHRFLIRESHQISSSNLQRKHPPKAIDSRTPKNIGVEIKPMELSATTKNEKENNRFHRSIRKLATIALKSTQYHQKRP
ncbi:hypothetical protein ISN44_As06g025840 [Arabidopsis suecica]|uniref:Uncharacterized protein n=1 Tax=Arabidopsis suecica TaxID=45249 RepID=A0A8T2CFY0_ARASU|nr:hypothetical protein ISN44_As06g025840 [Arabidopsis suecica]